MDQVLGLCRSTYVVAASFASGSGVLSGENPKAGFEFK